MIVQPDVILTDAFPTILKTLKDDAGKLDLIFKNRPAEQLKEIKHFFTENDIPVVLGYPRSATDLPGLFITIGSGTESDDFIGGSFPDDEAPGMDVSGAYFDVSVSIGCIATNANLTVWLAAVALWSLLGLRQFLNDAGIVEQRIQFRDFGPEDRFSPTFTFRRDIVLMGKTPATFEQDIFGEIIKSFQVIVTPTTFEESDALVETE